MSQSHPSGTRRTCLLALTDQTPPGLWLARLRSDGQIGQRQICLALDDTGCLVDRSLDTAKSILSLIAGYQVIHFDAPHARTPLDELIAQHAMMPIDNNFHDIAPFVRRLLGGDTNAKISLHQTPGICGRSPKAPSRAQAEAPEVGRLLEMIYVHLVKPKLGSEKDLGSSARRETRDYARINLSDRGLPLPAPLIPALPPPSGGWRNDAWTPAETNDVAQRYADGADLEDLALLTRRSPRGIVSRLQLNGILQRS